MLLLAPQAKACGPGEAYRPTTVDIVLGRQDVLLRDPHGRLVKRAPTSRDLWDLGTGYYIDLPGNPLNPGCGYEKQFRRWNDGRPPSVYAHVATDPSHPGKLAVEYWFYYTFNDFTDKHESDWEMAQVDFTASTPAASPNRPVRGRPVPARGRGAVGVDQHQAPEGRHASAHL